MSTPSGDSVLSRVRMLESNNRVSAEKVTVSRRYYQVKKLQQSNSPRTSRSPRKKLEVRSNYDSNWAGESGGGVQWPANNPKRHPLDRTIGVEEGAGWFCSEEHSASDSEQAVAPQPATMSSIRSPSPKVPETKSARLKAIRNRPALRYNRELTRNLHDASVVIHEERSSVASGSSSSRSSLSTEELGNVAQKALQLSKVHDIVRASKNGGNPPIQKMFETKRAPPKAMNCEAASDKSHSVTSLHAPYQVTASTASETSSNSSNSHQQARAPKQSLSKRLSRAERYASIKKHSERKVKKCEAEDGSLASSEATDPKGVHPVYGYGTRRASSGVRQGARREMDDSSTITTDSPVTSVSPQTVPSQTSDRRSRSDRLASVSGYRAYRRNFAASHSPIPKVIQHKSPTHDSPNIGQGAHTYVQAQNSPDSATKLLNRSLTFRMERAKAVREALDKQKTDQPGKEIHDAPEEQHNTSPPAAQDEFAATTPMSRDPDGFIVPDEESAFIDDVDEQENDTEDSQGDRKGFVETWSPTGQGRQYNAVTALADNPAKILTDKTHDANKVSGIVENSEREELRNPLESIKAQSLSQSKNTNDANDVESPSSSRSPSHILDSLAKHELESCLDVLSDVDQSTLHGEGISYSSIDGSSVSRKSSIAPGLTPLLYTTSTSVGTGGSSSHKTSSVESRTHLVKTQLGDSETMTYTSSSGPERQSTNDDLRSASKSTSSNTQSYKNEAIQWYTKNYGQSPPGKIGSGGRSLSPLASKSRVARKLQDDDDDIFSGLDDAEDKENEVDLRKTAPVSPGLKSRNSQGSQQDRQPLARPRDAIASLNDIIPPPPPAQAKKSGKKSKRSPSHTRKSAVPVDDVPPPPPSPSPRRPRSAKNAIAATRSPRGRMGMVLDDSGNESVQSDITSSLISGKDSKLKWFKKRHVHAIQEDEVENGDHRRQVESDRRSAERAKEDLLDDSVVVNNISLSKATAGNKEEPSMLLSLGYSLFDSVAEFCRLPLLEMQQKLPSSTTECADKTRHACEQLVGDESAINTYRDDRDRSIISSFLMPNDPDSPTSTYLSMNEHERRLWDNWEAQGRKDPDGEGGTSAKQLEHIVQRREAQAELIEVVNTAVSLYGGAPKGIDPPMDKAKKEDTVERTGSKPDPESGEAQRANGPTITLSSFSTSLTNEGVEVLKLGRRNKWQVRYLTVTKEVIGVSHQPAGVAPVQCPRGLLWLKRRSSANAHSLNYLRGHGRGGLLFSNLNKIESVKRERTSASKSFDKAPKWLKKSFPSFICVSVDYSYEEKMGPASHRSVLLCFKTKDEAETFVTAMNIIKAVVAREKGLLRKK